MHGYAALFAPPREPTLAHLAALRLTYAALENYFACHCAMPAISELAEIMGISTPTVSRRLIDMEQLGWISRDTSRQRSIVLRGTK